MYYVYVLERKDKPYVGYTNDLRRRFSEHQKEYDCKLVYYEAYLSEKSARQREKRLKYHGSAWRSLRKRINSA